ncbi:MAG: hypothetical protein COA62_11735 [Rhodobiaceae bacterium]|nr:MAG: hypothetical protein COA62_11735 [Rhodobiaceae bacterium]
MIVCSLVWYSSLLLWLGQTPTVMLAATMGVMLFSPVFYSLVLIRQNYNLLGWVFFAPAVYCVMQGHWEWAAILWLGASFGSITAAIFGIVLSTAVAAASLSPMPILVLLPAVLKMATHLVPAFAKGTLLETVRITLGSIGADESSATLKRPVRGLLKRRADIYQIFLFIQFSVVAWWIPGEPPVVFLAIVFLLLFNNLIARFSDPQSIWIAGLITSAMIVLQLAHWEVFASFVLLIMPHPRRTRLFRHKKGQLLPVARLFDVERVLSPLRDFLAPVPENGKVLFACPDPEGNLRNVYGGQRVLQEALAYVAAQRRIHHLPDWWAIYDSEVLNIPVPWGITPAEVRSNMEKFSADYAIVSTFEGVDVSDEWAAAGYQTIRKLDWCADTGLTKNNLPVKKIQPPVWHLMKLEKDANQE